MDIVAVAGYDGTTKQEQEGTGTVELNLAIQIVVRDVHASYPHLSRPLAIKHALDTTNERDLNLEDPTAPAYQALHRASTATLVLAVAKAGNIQLDRGDVVEIDGEATIDGLEPFVWMDMVFYS